MPYDGRVVDGRGATNLCLIHRFIPRPLAFIRRAQLQRKPLSKRTRFEIFQRDGFTCQYCGARPPSVVLEVDHIHPRVSDGDNEDLNLLTSCEACNRGKGIKILSDIPVRPDADLKFLGTQQEIAEARRFLESRSELDALNKEIVVAIQGHWETVANTKGQVPADHVVHQWLGKYSPEEIVHAVNVIARLIQREPWKFRDFRDYVKYVGGILRNTREDRGVA